MRMRTPTYLPSLLSICVVIALMAGAASDALGQALELTSETGAPQWKPTDPVYEGKSPAEVAWIIKTKKASPGVLRPDASDEERDNFLAQLPDWSGVRQIVFTNGTIFDTLTADPPHASGLEPGERQWPPYTAEYEARYRKFLSFGAVHYTDPYNYCMPAGMPRMLTNPMAHEWVITPEVVYHISEYDSQVRRIFTDGRYHPPEDELVPTWSGHSIGFWDGDTLVVETVGVREPRYMDTDNVDGGLADQIIDRSGPTLSGAVRFTERIRKRENGTLEDIVVVNDTVALTQEWVVERLFTLMPEDSFAADLLCEEAMSTPQGERNPVIGGVTQATTPYDPPGYFLDPEGVTETLADKLKKLETKEEEE